MVIFFPHLEIQPDVLKAENEQSGKSVGAGVCGTLVVASAVLARAPLSQSVPGFLLFVVRVSGGVVEKFYFIRKTLKLYQLCLLVKNFLNTCET